MTAEKFVAQFTTSQEAADERKEGRSKLFSDNVSVTEGSRKPSRVKEVPVTPLKRQEPQVFPCALSPRQQKILKK